MSYTIGSSVTHQQRHIRRHRRSLDALTFFNQLTSNELLNEAESHLPNHRERLFPPTQTLSMFLAQTVSDDRSCQSVVNQSALSRIVSGLPQCSTATGGYCRARQRLPMTMVSELTRFTGKLIDHKVEDKWRWQGRRVRIVDGTTVTLPDTAANQQRYPQISNQKPGLGFPICQLVGMTCLSSGALLDAAMCRIGGKGHDEQSLLRLFVKDLKKQ